MLTINSISGGQTSAYMAVHFPADINIFAVVLTDDVNCQIHDKGLLNAVHKKCPVFNGSRELDQTLINVLRLEQDLQKEIIWVYGVTYDELIKNKKMLPNSRHRFCTTELKIKPIFNWCWMNILKPKLDKQGSFVSVTPVFMNIGFRFDEGKRVNRALTQGSCEKSDFATRCDIVGTFKGKHRRIKTCDWRIKNFPLYDNKITKKEVEEYWKSQGYIFPEVSNCDYCFFHTPDQITKQYSRYPQRHTWWKEKENEIGAKFLNPNNTKSCQCTD